MWQPATTNSVARLRRSSKAFPKDKLCVHTHTKGHSHCLVAWCQSDPLQLSESWWNHYIWEVCSANLWDSLKTAKPAAILITEWAQFLSTTMPDHMSHNQHFKSWMYWATKFCLICHIHLASHQMTPTSSSILTTFCWEKCFHNQQDAEILFQGFLKSQSMDFYATGINKLISC